jgi:hypothetical protein
MNGLYLHCGSTPTELSNIATAFTPQPTETHYPISHQDFLNTVEDGLSKSGLTVDKRSYGLSHDDNRMFSLYELSRDNGENGTFKNVLGIRNAHDKAFSAGLVCGSKVFVCDNLAFSGEIKMNRKHTANIMRDLPDLVYAMISDVVAGWLSQECRYEGYQETSLNQSKTDEIMGAALRNKSIPASKHDQVLKEWNEPKHEEFEPRNAWSMFNAFTEVMKTAPRQLPKRTITLHRVFDEFCEDAITSRMESRGVAKQSDFNIDDVEDAEIVGGLGLTYQLG